MARFKVELCWGYEYLRVDGRVEVGLTTVGQAGLSIDGGKGCLVSA